MLELGSSRWAVVHTGLYFYQRDENVETAGDWFLKFFDFGTRQTKRITKLSGIPLIGQRPAVSPDGQTLLFAQRDLNDTDLILVENFR